MSDVTVRALGPEDWQAYRELRLRALAEAPTAFTNTAEQEQGFDEALWRARMTRSTRLLASADDAAEGGAAVGIVSVGQAEPDVAELFGMWVVPSSRGAGVAWRLMPDTFPPWRTVYADAGYQGPWVAAASPIRVEVVRKLEGQVGFTVHARR